MTYRKFYRSFRPNIKSRLNATTLILMGQSDSGLALVTLGTGLWTYCGAAWEFACGNQWQHFQGSVKSHPNLELTPGGSTMNTASSSNATQQKTCSHPNCSCSIAPSDEYCSDSCSTAAQGNDTRSACTCPHPGCKREAKAA